MQSAEWDEISQPFPSFNAVQLKFRIGKPLNKGRSNNQPIFYTDILAMLYLPSTYELTLNVMGKLMYTPVQK